MRTSERIKTSERGAATTVKRPGPPATAMMNRAQCNERTKSPPIINDPVLLLRAAGCAGPGKRTFQGVPQTRVHVDTHTHTLHGHWYFSEPSLIPKGCAFLRFLAEERRGGEVHGSWNVGSSVLFLSSTQSNFALLVKSPFAQRPMIAGSNRSSHRPKRYVRPRAKEEARRLGLSPVKSSSGGTI